MVWIPVRTVYHKELEIADFLKEEGLEVFIPMKYELREKGTADGECERILVPAIHNLLFVRREYCYDWCIELMRRMPVPVFLSIRMLFSLVSLWVTRRGSLPASS